MKFLEFNPGKRKLLPTIIGIVVITIGLLVLTGWIFKISTLKSLLPYWPTMKPNVAIGIILCGIIVLLYVNNRESKFKSAYLLSGLVLLLGLFSLSNRLFQDIFNPDFLIFNYPLFIEPMPFLVAVVFILIGLCFLMINTKNKIYSLLFNLLLFIIGFISLMSILDYILPLKELTNVSNQPQMSLYGAVTFLLLVLSILFLSSAGIINYLTRRNLSEDSFRKILEATPDAMVIINEEGKIIFVNNQTERLFGYDKYELLNQFVEILIPESYREKHPTHRTNFFTSTKKRPMGIGMELFGMRKNKEIFPVEISLNPLDTHGGNVALAAIRDITDSKNFEKTLKEKNVELENAILAKDRFLASMSHELRTPLNAIIGFTGTLLMRLPGTLNQEQEKQLGIVKRNANYLLSLINDLLDLAKIDSGKIELNFEKTNCNDLIKEAYSSLLPLAKSKKLKLKLDLPVEELILYTDKRSLTQIIINLVNNAIKFTEKGLVVIKARKTKENKKIRLIIEIIDTGQGISLADQQNLFQAFQQVSKPGNHIEGTGLGLHLSQKLAQLIKGQITVKSELGKGSTFTIELPIKGETS